MTCDACDICARNRNGMHEASFKLMDTVVHKSYVSQRCNHRGPSESKLINSRFAGRPSHCQIDMIMNL